VLLAVGIDAEAIQPVLQRASFDFRSFYEQILCAEMQVRLCVRDCGNDLVWLNAHALCA
jgi:hypothetical protein